jgi:hypothetical protein
VESNWDLRDGTPGCLILFTLSVQVFPELTSEIEPMLAPLSDLTFEEGLKLK